MPVCACRQDPDVAENPGGGGGGRRARGGAGGGQGGALALADTDAQCFGDC